MKSFYWLKEGIGVLINANLGIWAPPSMIRSLYISSVSPSVTDWLEAIKTRENKEYEEIKKYEIQ